MKPEQNTRRLRRMGALLLAATCVASATGAADGKTEIFLEAESFRGRGWQVSDMGYCWGAPHLWSKAKLAADASDRRATASRTVEIPHAGRYALWVHYEDVAGFDHYFSVRVSQGGKERLAADFGRRETSKYIPFAPTPLTRHELRWWYHHGDLVYERRELDLDAGPATFRIEKGGNGPAPAKRFVDFLMLTDDLDDNPIRGSTGGWFEDFVNRTADSNRMYVRLSLPESAPSPLAVHGATPWPHQPPFYVFGSCYYTPTGREDRLIYAPPSPAAFLEPGQSTPWTKLSLRTTGDNLHRLTAWPGDATSLNVLKTRGAPYAAWIAAIDRPATLQGLRVELAADPEGKQLLRALVVEEPVTRFDILFTRDCRRPEHIATRKEINAERRRWLAEAHPVGRLPTRFPITCGFAQVLAHDIRRAMGETWPAIGGYIDADTMQAHGFTGFKVDWYVGYVKLPEPKLYDDYRALCENRLEEFRQHGVAEGYPKIIKLIDEPGMWSLDAMAAHPFHQEGFRRYLRERDLAPERFLGPDAVAALAAAAAKGEAMSPDALYALVRLGSRGDAGRQPELYYHSQRYRAETFAAYYRPYARIAHDVYGDQCFGAPVNLAPNKLTFAQGWGDGIDYIDFFRSGGSTMMMSESWYDNVPGLISQTDAVLIDLFRCAAKYDGYPLGQYVICDSNRSITPTSTALKAVTTVAHGAAFIEYYCGEGAYPGRCDGPLLEQKDLFQAIARVNYAVGELEDVFLEGRLPAARVALLWNRSAMIWDTAPHRRNFSDEWFNVYTTEFQWLHLILRHAGYWVDVLTEDDCAQGRLADYRALFLVGEQIQLDAAEAIRRWVAEGGVLFAPAGGGLRDEYNRPLDTLKPAYGIEAAELQRVHRTLNLKVELPRQAPVDRLTPTAAGREHGLPPMDALAFRQELKPAKEDDTPEGGGPLVLARFADGDTPAMVLNRFGQGAAVLCGALPGAAYLKPSVPVGVFSRSLEPDDLMDFRPTQFADHLRPYVTLPLALAGLSPDAGCEPAYVEAVVWETEDRYVVVLINHGGTPLKAVRVFLHGLGPIDAAQSQQGASLVMETGDGQVRLRLALDLYDFLVLDKKEG